MIHYINFHFYDGGIFRCAYCDGFGFFPFYPQMHDKCWREAINKVRFVSKENDQ